MKVTKTEVFVIALLVVCVLAFGASLYALSIHLNRAAAVVSEKGLKSVVEEIWCGESGCSEPQG